MKCLCGYSDEPGFDHLNHSVPFIKFGAVELITDLSGVMGHPIMGDGVLHGMTDIFACPFCGTVRVK